MALDPRGLTDEGVASAIEDRRSIIAYRQRELDDLEAEQKRRGAEASRSYGEREALGIFRERSGRYMDCFIGDWGFGVELAVSDGAAEVRYRAILSRVAAAIDAARADMREQAAKVIDVAQSLGSATIAERRTEFVDRIAVAAAIRRLK